MATTTISLGKTTGAIRLVSALGVTNTAESSMCSPAAGQQVTIKHIKATNTDSITSYLCVSIGADVAATRIIDQVAIAANSEYNQFATHILKSGDILCASASVAAKVTLTIDGINELTA
jgi:hypothetical protein